MKPNNINKLSNKNLLLNYKRLYKALSELITINCSYDQHLEIDNWFLGTIQQLERQINYLLEEVNIRNLTMDLLLSDSQIRNKYKD